jgi:quinol monooxygenase YgiN
LENAVPVAGFVIRPDKIGAEYRPEDYIRSGKLTTAPGQVDQVIEIIKTEVPGLLNAEKEILSFLAMKSHEEEDTIIIWERFSSRDACGKSNAEGGVYARFMDNIKGLQAGKMTNYTPVLGYLSKA